MAGKIIIKNAVKRDPAYMYYIDGQGNICRAARGAVKKKSKK